MVCPSRSAHCASCLAAVSSSIVTVASRGWLPPRRTVSSLLSQHPRKDCSHLPSALSAAPMSSRAWSPCESEGELSQKLWTESGFHAKCSLVVRKAPKVSLASWQTSFWRSPSHHSSDPKRAAAWTRAAWTFSGETASRLNASMIKQKKIIPRKIAGAEVPTGTAFHISYLHGQTLDYSRRRSHVICASCLG